MGWNRYTRLASLVSRCERGMIRCPVCGGAMHGLSHLALVNELYTREPSHDHEMLLGFWTVRVSDALELPALPVRARTAAGSDLNPAVVYLSQLASPSSRETQRSALNLLALRITEGQCNMDTFPWAELRYEHVAAIRTYLADRTNLQPSTVNRYLAAVRGTLQTARRLGQIDADHAAAACDVQVLPLTGLLRGRALTLGELERLFRVCAEDHRASGRRNAALLALLYGCGLRRAEAIGLQLEDYDVDALVLKVKGKGNRWRYVPVPPGARDALAEWIALRGPQPGHLVTAVEYGDGVVYGEPAITTVRVYQIVARLARAAHLEHTSPHDLRRSYVTHLLDAGADPLVVQKLAGHLNVSTTARYDRRGDAAKRRAADLLPVPFVRPEIVKPCAAIT